MNALESLKKILEAAGVNPAAIPESLEIEGPAKLSEAGPEHLSFLANMKYESELYETDAAAVLVPEGFRPKKEVKCTLIPVPDPYAVLTALLEKFNEEDLPYGVEEPVLIDRSATIGADTFIGAFTVIREHAVVGDGSRIDPDCFIGKHVVIGKRCRIHPGVRIYRGCVIGDDCTIHSGTVIGADGFGFTPGEKGRLRKVPQIGNVVIGDDVEIGSNCTIDRATMGSTRIHDGVKLDNLIQVGHNAEIGAHTVIAAQSGVSGSTKLGEHCMLGGQVGLAGHLYIAPGTKINAKSGVAKSVKEPRSRINGIPAWNFTDSLRSHSVYRRLPDLEDRLREMEAEMQEILSLLRK